MIEQFNSLELEHDPDGQRVTPEQPQADHGNTFIPHVTVGSIPSKRRINEASSVTARGVQLSICFGDLCLGGAQFLRRT